MHVIFDIFYFKITYTPNVNSSNNFHNNANINYDFKVEYVIFENMPLIFRTKKKLREKNKKKTDVQPALGSASELSIHGFPREVDSSTARIFAESQPTKTTNKHKRPPTKRIQKRHHHRR